MKKNTLFGSFASFCRLNQLLAAGTAAAILPVCGPAHSADALKIETVLVGDAGNAPDDTGLGGVDYEFQIGKYEVTNAQYAAFLNAVAATDTRRLYTHYMGEMGIRRNGSPGSHTYEVMEGFENQPVRNVSFFGALRFANWLSNGCAGGDTETGAYEITEQSVQENSVARVEGWKEKPGLVMVPSADEWYKAAYYEPGGGGYFDFPIGSGEAPVAEAPPGGPTSANFGEILADETNPNGKPTEVGAYTECRSACGTHDQGGNLWEWTDSALDAQNRSARGASYCNGGGNMSRKAQLPIAPHTESPSIGFRVMSLKPIPDIQP